MLCLERSEFGMEISSSNDPSGSGDQALRPLPRVALTAPDLHPMLLEVRHRPEFVRIRSRRSSPGAPGSLRHRRFPDRGLGCGQTGKTQLSPCWITSAPSTAGIRASRHDLGRGLVLPRDPLMQVTRKDRPSPLRQGAGPSLGMDLNSIACRVQSASLERRTSCSNRRGLATLRRGAQVFVRLLMSHVLQWTRFLRVEYKTPKSASPTHS